MYFADKCGLELPIFRAGVYIDFCNEIGFVLTVTTYLIVAGVLDGTLKLEVFMA